MATTRRRTPLSNKEKQRLRQIPGALIWVISSRLPSRLLHPWSPLLGPSLLPDPEFLRFTDSCRHDRAAFLVDNFLLSHSHTASSAISLETSPAPLPPFSLEASLPPTLIFPAFTCLFTNSFHQRNVSLAFLQKPFWASIYSSNKYLPRAYSVLHKTLV